MVSIGYMPDSNITNSTGFNISTELQHLIKGVHELIGITATSEKNIKTMFISLI